MGAWVLLGGGSCSLGGDGEGPKIDRVFHAQTKCGRPEEKYEGDIKRHPHIII